MPVIEVEFFDLPDFPVEAVQFITFQIFDFAQHNNSFVFCVSFSSLPASGRQRV
jgi:hypothetical protein